MQAIICSKLTGPEALEVRNVAIPLPGPGEIRICVKAAAVNFPDGLITQGLYQFKPGLPFTPGSEAAGIVDAIGEGVTVFRVGDRVACVARWGAFAEYMVAPAASAFALPAAMSFEIAAGFGMAYGTSYHALVQRGGVQAGETVLVLGAGGGVGLAAVQIAKAIGAKVIAAASSPAKLGLARASGADETIDYSHGDLKSAVKSCSNGLGVDIVYDPVGGVLAEPAMRSIAWGGRYLVVGFASGTIPSLPVNLALIKNAAILGVFWGAWSDREPIANKENFAQLMLLYAAGKLDPCIDATFDLSDASKAISWVADGHAKGKIVIRVDGGESA
jgi:NADPH2:quinone reductase